MSKSRYPKFGSIYLYAGSRHSGDSKIRPGVIVSKDIINQSHRTVQVAPITSDTEIPKGLYAIRFELPKNTSGILVASVVMCDKTTTILKNRLRGEAIATLDACHIEHLKKCLRMAHENSPVMASVLIPA